MSALNALIPVNEYALSRVGGFHYRSIHQRDILLKIFLYLDTKQA